MSDTDGGLVRWFGTLLSRSPQRVHATTPRWGGAGDPGSSPHSSHSPHLLPMHRLELTLGTAIPGGRPVVLTGVEAARHKLAVGVTGAGKSKFLATLFLQLVNQGVGTCLVDPHGDLADDCLLLLAEAGFFADAPRTRAYERVLYLDFSCGDRFVPFNVLSQPYEPHQTAANVLEAVKRSWTSLAGGSAPVLENLVLFGSYLLAVNEQPLTRLPRLLSDSRYRQRLRERITDPGVLEFFDRFDRQSGRRADVLSESTMRRVSLLSFTPALRYSLGQAANLLRMRDLMDRGVSVLVNLGGLDAETQRFLGALIAIGVEEAALSRADMPEDARRPYHLIVDEFSQFSARSSESMDRVLSLTRKYGLSLTLACQVFGQIPAELRASLQQTTFIGFRLGHADAGWGAERVATIDPRRLKYSASGHAAYMSAGEQRAEWERLLASLPPREAVLRTQGSAVRFLTLGVQPPTPAAREQLAAIKETYARRLLTPKGVVEAEMMGAGQGGAARGMGTREVGALDALDAPPTRSTTARASHASAPTAGRPGRGWRAAQRRVSLLEEDIVPHDGPA